MVNIHKLARVTESGPLSAPRRHLPGAFTGLFLALFPCRLDKLQGFSLMVNKLQSASELRSDIRLVMVLPEWKSYFFQNLDINKPSDPSCSISPNHFQNPIQQLWFYKWAVFPHKLSEKKQEQLKRAKDRGNCSVMHQGA